MVVSINVFMYGVVYSVLYVNNWQQRVSKLQWSNRLNNRKLTGLVASQIARCEKKWGLNHLVYAIMAK